MSETVELELGCPLCGNREIRIAVMNHKFSLYCRHNMCPGVYELNIWFATLGEAIEEWYRAIESNILYNDMMTLKTAMKRIDSYIRSGQVDAAQTWAKAALKHLDYDDEPAPKQKEFKTKIGRLR